MLVMRLASAAAKWAITEQAYTAPANSDSPVGKASRHVRQPHVCTSPPDVMHSLDHLETKYKPERAALVSCSQRQTQNTSSVSGRRHSRRVPDPRELSHATSATDDVINYPHAPALRAAATNTLFTPSEACFPPQYGVGVGSSHLLRRRLCQYLIASVLI